MQQKNLHIRNKKAAFDFHIELKFTAGIQLTGTEVKSIRALNANINDAFCIIEGGELYIKNMHISEFKQGSYNNHDPLRKRKLLVTKQELNKIIFRTKEKGFTIFPLDLHLSDRGLLKLDIALGRGKREFDKRHDIKKKDIEREIKNAIG
ncbi:MAG: SsrA-binding protein SmpB [Bacteroidia bacterium]|nr:SsrA-binding protein SmpB [Bacteroidia bacterium]